MNRVQTIKTDSGRRGLNSSTGPVLVPSLRSWGHTSFALATTAALLLGCSGGQGEFDGGTVRDLPPQVTDAQGGSRLEAGAKPTDSDARGSGQQDADGSSATIQAGELDLGVEITGVNLSSYEGVLEIDGKALADAELVFDGTECRGKTDALGRFAINCPADVKTSKLSVAVVMAGQSRIVSLDAEGFRKVEVAGSGAWQPPVVIIPIVHTFTNLVLKTIGASSFVEGSEAFQDDSAFWSGTGVMPLGVSLLEPKADSFAPTQALHNVSHNLKAGLSLLSDCNQVMGVLQSVPSSQPVTLSFQDGLMAHSLAFRRGDNEQLLSLPGDDALSWICGTAYDVKRDLFWASSFGGSGLLLSVKDESSPLTIQAQFVGPDLGEMAYLSATDELIGVDAVGSAQSAQPTLGLLRRAPLAGLTLLPAGSSNPPSSLTVTERALQPSIPLCFRDSNIQMHDGFDAAYLHVTDNLSVQRFEASTGVEASGSEKHRIYRIQPDGRTKLLFSTDGRVGDGSSSLPSGYCSPSFGSSAEVVGEIPLKR